MRYFTSYLKKVILIRNSRYLQCVTPNTADYTHAFLNSQQWSSTSTFTGTAGLSLANGSMAVCVAIHCASAVSVEASPPSLSRCAVISVGVSPELVCIHTASRSARWQQTERTLCSEPQLPLSVWRCAPSSCAAAAACWGSRLDSQEPGEEWKAWALV